jgi:uncharacterized YccA/Bax inhibitor family protein
MARAYSRMPDYFPAAPGTGGFGGPREAVRPFSARAAYNKVGVLICIAVVTAMAGWWLNSPALGGACIAIALVASLVGVFRPGAAKVTAPIYAAAEGIVLGWISSAYATLGRGVVPVSVVFTAVVFLGCWAAFRSGVVRVTRRFWTVTLVATLGLGLVYLLSLFGLPVPGADDIGTKGIMLGLFGLAVGVLNLFVDFSFIQTLEAGAIFPGRRTAALLSSDGEWYAAQCLMVSLVLVYLSVLRIVGAATGNGRR